MITEILHEFTKQPWFVQWALAAIVVFSFGAAFGPWMALTNLIDALTDKVKAETAAINRDQA